MKQIKNHNTLNVRGKAILFSKKFLWTYFGFTLYFLLFISCANPSMPTGGPKDVSPPEIMLTTPANYTTDFESEKIILFFDEYVQLSEAASEILFSPPLNGKPEYKIKGKSIEIILKDSTLLLPNTTYSIFFGESISDLNEGNVLHNFSYVFSTGSYIDSLSMHGIIKNAFNLLEPENTFVMLYKDNNDTIPFDSLPFFVKPFYITKVINGGFALHNLRGGNYKLFALEDENGNYLYDYPDENIAFIHELIEPTFASFGQMTPDSINPFIFGGVPIFYKPGAIRCPIIDEFGEIKWQNLSVWQQQILDQQKEISTQIVVDSISDVKINLNTLEIILDNNIAEKLDTIFDTVEHQHCNHPNVQELLLFSFKTIDSSMSFIDFAIADSTKINLFFTQPPDSLQITLLQPIRENHSEWFIKERSTTGDTISLWIPKRPADTLLITIDAAGIETDTLEIALIKPSLKTKRRKSRRKKEEEKTAPSLVVKSKATSDYFKSVYLTFNAPLKNVLQDTFLLVVEEDSLQAPLEFCDSLKLKAKIKYDFKPDTKYKYIIPDSVFWDIFGFSQDSLAFSFATKPLDSYGSLTMHVEVPDFEGDFIIQMLRENESVLKSKIIQESKIIDFGYVDPGKYLIKVIFDKNRNGRWDSGDYIRNIQPERVSFFSKTIDLRSNWLIEENWKILR